MSNSESDEHEIKYVPVNTTQEDTELPVKSKKKYEKAYDEFVQWKLSKEGLTLENCLLMYFQEMIDKYKPTTVWTTYSMLKAVIKIKESVDIGQFHELMAKLKKHADIIKRKTAKIFTVEELQRFLKEAPDDIHLSNKALIIFGIMGCCSSDELAQIRVQNVKEEGSLLLVTMPRTKVNKPRQFTIDPELSKIVKKYQSLRPKDITNDRFFLNYQKRKCTRQPIGKNKICNVPRKIASWLKLENPENYTGHALRKTSASTLSSTVRLMMDVDNLDNLEPDDVPQVSTTCQKLKETVVFDNKSIKQEIIDEISLDESDEECSPPPLKQTKFLHVTTTTGSSIITTDKVIHMHNCTVNIHY